MAHTPRLAPALVAAAFAALPARGLELGPLEVGSALGEPLDARVPLKAQAGEHFEAACFYLSHGGLPEGARLAMTLERSARGTALRIRGTAPLAVPAASLRVTVACPGREPQAPRDFALLLDPRTRIRPATAGPAPAIGATIAARDGASLDSIAHTLFPHDAKARALYLDALAAANPGLAARGSTSPIEAGAPVGLPDLRTFAATRRAASQGPVPPAREDRVAAAPATTRSAPVRGTPRQQPVETELPPPPTRAALPAKLPVAKPEAPPPQAAPAQPMAPIAKSEPPPAAAKPASAAATRTAPRSAPGNAGDGFVLRLSGSEIDLSRSRGIDDRRRAQLRERQLVLDSDDHLSALLAMRHSLKQLEARVSELQLKLAGMPATFPERPPAGAVGPATTDSGRAPATPATVAPAPASAPALPDRPRANEAAGANPPVQTALPPAATPPSPPAPAAITPAPPAPAVATTAASPPPAPSATRPSAAAVPAVTSPSPKPAVVKPAAATPPAGAWDFERLRRDYGWWAVALLAALALAAAFALWRRRAAAGDDDAAAAEEDALPETQPPVGDVGEIAAPVVPAAAPDSQRATISSDAHLPTRLRDTDSGDLRRRYIEERFPEVASRAIRLEDTDSVVKGARLFYEDGEIPRAVELLQLAIEARPDEARLWLALFEIFRLERLAGEFGELARRFQERFGDTDHWRKVQFFGREVDPGNPLYKVEPVATLETIGPREARKLAAAKAAFDPIAENWLNAPMDFENEVLANDLRRSLMAEAGIAEHDLMPAPMNALRNVEVFTVA